MLLLLFLMGLFGDPPAPAAALPADLTASAVRGEAAVRSRCSACHAVGAGDLSPNPAAPPLREIRSRYPVDNLEEALADGILVAHDSPMPAFVLEPDEIADVIAYLRELGAPPAR